MSEFTIVLILGALLLASFLFSYINRRFKIPDVLLLFLAGIIMGPVLGLIKSDDFGKFGELFALITLGIILFEAGLHIKIKTLLDSLGSALGLIFFNLSATIGLVFLINYWFLNISPALAIAVGTILGGTSATVIVSLIQNLALQEKTKTLLKLESTLNNAVVIVLVIFALEAYKIGVFEIESLVPNLAWIFALSVVFGTVAGFVWSKILAILRNSKETLFATPAIILIILGLAELSGANGAITVFLFGITLGNLQSKNTGLADMYPQEAEFRITEKENAFFASLVFLLKTYFFIFIGIAMDFSEPLYVLAGAGIALALFGLRWLIIGFFFKWKLPRLDKFIIKTMAPKGLTEAALLILVGNQFLNRISYPVIMFSIIYASIIVFYAKYHFRENAKLPEKEI